MRVFGESNQKFSRAERYAGGRLVSVQRTVAFLFVRLDFVGKVFYRFPPDGFRSFKQQVDVNVIAVQLQYLFIGRYTFRIDMVNKHVVSLNFDASVFGIQQVVSLLRSQNVNVSQFYLDDCLLFDQIKEVLVLDPQVGHFPILGNTIEWCQDLLNTLFSFPLLMGIKQSVHFRIRCVCIGDGGLYELSKERVSHRTLQRAIPRSL